jgi:hypothetical protein
VGTADAALDTRSMFIRYFVQIPMPFEAVETALLDEPDGWIPGLARDAGDRGEELLVEVGFGAAGRRVQREVEITIGKPMRYASKTVLPITWKPTAGDHLPSMEADLEVAPLGGSRTQFAISARYDPPLGAFGRTVDRALLHRVAEATVKDFLDRGALKLTSLPTMA